MPALTRVSILNSFKHLPLQFIMIRFISTYFKIALMVACTLVGIQVPGFVDQYGKHLHARLLESNRALTEFQDDADKYFGGDLNKLIAHYKQSGDNIVIEGGNSIEAIATRNQALQHANTRFNQSVLNRYTHALFAPIKEIQREVWTRYSFNVLLSKSTLVVGVLIGLSCLLFFECVLWLGKKIGRMIYTL